jgi:hypothetical protein
VGVAKFLAMDNLERNLGVTHLESFAQQMHEVYSTLLNASFTPDQAMELLLHIAGKGRKSV